MPSTESEVLIILVSMSQLYIYEIVWLKDKLVSLILKRLKSCPRDNQEDKSSRKLTEIEILC